MTATARSLDFQLRAGSITVTDAHLGIWENDVDEPGIRPVFHQIVAYLDAELGFAMTRDPKMYPSISPWTRVGKRGDLELSIHQAGRHIELNFFQNVEIENHNGGQYDFGRLRRMAKVRHALRIECLTVMWQLVRLFVSFGYRLQDRHHAVLEPTIQAMRNLADGDPNETALDAFNRSWSPGRFERGPDGWPSEKETRCWPDRFKQGEIKYARVNGRLMRGATHGGINGMWKLVCNGQQVAYYAHEPFFDCPNPDQEPRRFFHDLEMRMCKRIDKALKEKDYLRVANLSAALARQLKQERPAS